MCSIIVNDCNEPTTIDESPFPRLPRNVLSFRALRAINHRTFSNVFAFETALPLEQMSVPRIMKTLSCGWCITSACVCIQLRTKKERKEKKKYKGIDTKETIKLNTESRLFIYGYLSFLSLLSSIQAKEFS